MNSWNNERTFNNAAVCFTTPSEAKIILNELNGDSIQNNHNPLPLHTLRSVTESAISLLQIIKERIRVCQPPFNPTENIFSYSFSYPWLTGCLPAGNFWQSAENITFHIQAGFLCVNSLTADNISNEDKKKNFCCIKVFQQERQRLKKYLRSHCPDSSAAVPLIIVVLQEKDFAFMQPDGPLCSSLDSAFLPILLCDDSPVNTELPTTSCASNYRFWGIPKGLFTYPESPQDLLRLKKACASSCVSDACFERCCAMDADGPIMFVSSAYILHSFFFRHACVLKDFLFDPLRQLSPAKDNLNMVANILGYSYRESSSSGDREAIQGINRKRRRTSPEIDIETGTNADHTELVTKNSVSCFYTDDEGSLSSVDKVFVELKLQEIWRATEEGYPIQNILFCEKTLLSSSTDDAISPEQTLKKVQKDISQPTRKRTFRRFFISPASVISALEGPSIDKELLEATSMDTLFGSGAIPQLSESSNMSTELADLFNEQGVLRSGMDKTENNCTEGIENDELLSENCILDRGKSLMVSLFSAYQEQDSSLSNSASTLNLDDNEKYRVMLLLQVLDERQDELAHIIRLISPLDSLFRNETSATMSQICSLPQSEKTYHPETASGISLFNLFWEEIASEVLSRQVQSEQRPSSRLSNCSVVSSTFTGKEALLLYTKWCARGADEWSPSQWREVAASFQLSADHQDQSFDVIARWRHHLIFILLYGVARHKCQEENASAIEPDGHALVQKGFPIPLQAAEIGATRKDPAEEYSHVKEIRDNKVDIDDIDDDDVWRRLVAFRVMRSYTLALEECMVALQSECVSRWLQHAPIKECQN